VFNRGKHIAIGSEGCDSETAAFEARYLSNIEPSYDFFNNAWYYPAALTTKEGVHHPRVMFVRRPDARRTICSLEWLEENDKRWMREVEIDPNEISSVRPSPFRLTVEVSRRLSRKRKGVRSCIFGLEDGTEQGYYQRSGGISQFDFLLMYGASPEEVRSVRFEVPPPVQVMPRATVLEYGEVRLCVYPGKGGARSRSAPYPRLIERKPHPDVGGKLGQVSVNERSSQQSPASDLIREVPDEALEDTYGDALRRKVNELGLVPATSFSPEVERALAPIPTVRPERIPCSLVLKDGTVVPRAIVVDEKFAVCHHGVWKHYVMARDVAEASESPYVIPLGCRKKLPEETSMGSLEFRVRMHDGALMACWYPAYSDFIDLPPPYRAMDIKDVMTGPARCERAVLEAPDFTWCVCDKAPGNIPSKTPAPRIRWGH